MAQGNLAEALTAYKESLAICERQVHGAPSSAEWQLYLAVSYNKVGDVLQLQGDLPAALTAW
jgi:hypothetical protein